jgi:hypothetical protein
MADEDVESFRLDREKERTTKKYAKTLFHRRSYNFTCAEKP